MPERVLLVDTNPEMTAAWHDAFGGADSVEIHEADFFSFDVDALVSPANSFGIMDAGLDLAIRDRLPGSEQAVQRVILERHHGELPVGQAEVVATDHARWPYLVCAPTMRVPENIASTVHPYLAFRAVLLAVRAFNDGEGARGFGRWPCRDSARGSVASCPVAVRRR